jgi:hypothetical protein
LKEGLLNVDVDDNVPDSEAFRLKEGLLGVLELLGRSDEVFGSAGRHEAIVR